MGSVKGVILRNPKHGALTVADDTSHCMQIHPVRTASSKFRKSHVLPTQMYLCVLCGSQNKQRLFPYTALTDWFV